MCMYVCVYICIYMYMYVYYIFNIFPFYACIRNFETFLSIIF